MEKIDHLPNGQWALSKSNQLFNDEGETHEVEVHPDIDHLYRVKDLINRSGRSHLHLQDIKHTGQFNHIIRRIPRDANGKVTAKMIDDHIEKLPKHKVIIKTAPYTWGAQMHSPNAKEHVVSVQLHPETLDKLDPNSKTMFELLKYGQHNLMPGGHLNNNQIGWARIDHSKPNHWHVDEIQSDFHSKDKIHEHLDDKEKFDGNWDTPHHYAIENLYDSFRMEAERAGIKDADDVNDYASNKFHKEFMPRFEEAKRNINSDDMHKLLSHGHEDPQHLVHSAINALARNKGIGSMSMDTVEDQLKQSNLNHDNEPDHVQRERDEMNFHNDQHAHYWKDQIAAIKDGSHPSLNNPNFKSAVDKLGGLDTLSTIAEENINGSPDLRYMEERFREDIEGGSAIAEKIRNLSDPEIHAVEEMMFNHNRTLTNAFNRINPDYEQTSKPSTIDWKSMPVHFLNTYHKRPRQLGYQSLPKKDILGEDDSADQQVQYSPVFKTIQHLKDKLKKIKGAK